MVQIWPGLFTLVNKCKQSRSYLNHLVYMSFGKVRLAATDCTVFALDFIHLTLDRVPRQAVVMNHRVVHNATTFLTRWMTTSFPIRILHYEPQKLSLTYGIPTPFRQCFNLHILAANTVKPASNGNRKGPEFFSVAGIILLIQALQFSVLRKADPWDRKCFPLKTGLRYARFPFQTSSLY